MAEGGARYISLQLIVECIWEYLAAGDWFEGGGRGIQVAFFNLPEYLALFGLACFQPPIYPNHQHPLTHDPAYHHHKKATATATATATQITT